MVSVVGVVTTVTSAITGAEEPLEESDPLQEMNPMRHKKIMPMI